MPVSESRRRANDRWDKENMATLTCKIKKEDAEKFKTKVKEEGQTTNAVLARFVKKYIEEPDQ